MPEIRPADYPKLENYTPSRFMLPTSHYDERKADRAVQSRMNGYAVGRQNGWYSANDIRELEDMNRIPTEDGGDRYLCNGNMIDIKSAGHFYVE